MSGTSNWKTVRKKRSTHEIEEAISREREILEAELQLAEIRKYRKRSQATVAKKLAVSQARVSTFERGADPKLSTVSNYIDALGGHLELVAVFDDERVPLKMAGRRTDKTVAKRRSGRGRARGTPVKASTAAKGSGRKTAGEGTGRKAK